MFEMRGKSCLFNQKSMSISSFIPKNSKLNSYKYKVYNIGQGRDRCGTLGEDFEDCDDMVDFCRVIIMNENVTSRGCASNSRIQ